MTTRIKICGITRAEDALACVQLGADALGFVFYPPSPRYVAPERAAQLVRLLPPFLTRVGLFVNAAPEAVRAVLAQVPLDLLQFHGDEDESYCASFGLPYLKAARVRPGMDLLEYAVRFPTARAILCDAFVEGFGGGGQTFDWSLIPAALPVPLVLSGGLTPENVGAALKAVRPAAVDVSSGVELAKGIKDHAKLADFIAEVRAADDSLRSS